MLRKAEISACLMGRLARMQTLPFFTLLLFQQIVPDCCELSVDKAKKPPTVKVSSNQKKITFNLRGDNLNYQTVAKEGF